MTDYHPLGKALEKWADKYLFELPPDLKRRVMSIYPLGSLWDTLHPEQRLAAARYFDQQHDPKLFDFNEYWFNFYARNRELERQIAEWQQAAAPTASDLHARQENILRLNQELTDRQNLERALLYRQFPHHEPSGDDEENSAIDDRTVWLAFPKALEILKADLNATAEEMAAWIYMGTGNGGLRAWLDQPRLRELNRFYFEPAQSGDYVTPLIRCWFIEQEILAFQPTERFITGKLLIEKWTPTLGDATLNTVQELVSGGRLMDLHPIQGGTQVSTNDPSSAALDTGLFALSEIAAVESNELSVYFHTPSLEDKRLIAAKKKQKVEAIFKEEQDQRGKRGALQRTADRLNLHRTTVSGILNR